MSSTLTPDQDHALNNLEPDERAAIAGDDASADDVDALKRIAAQSTVVNEGAAGADPEEDDEGDGEDGEDDDGTDAAAAAAAPAAAPAPAAAAAPASAPAPSPAAADEPEAVVVKPAFVLPDDFKEKSEGLAAEYKDLRAKYKAGEIELDEYETQRDELDGRRRELDLVQVRAQAAADVATQNELNRREAMVSAMFAAARQAGVDYEGNRDHYEELQTQFTALAQRDAQRANADPNYKPKGFDWAMREADKRVRTIVGAAPAPAAAPSPAPAPAAIKAKANADRTPPANSLPKSLAQVPGGEGPGDLDGDEFTELDKLEGDAYELALERLTPAKREQYVRSLTRH